MGGNYSDFNVILTGREEPSVGGVLLLLFAIVPYTLLVAMLPGAEDFPNEGGGEARMAWGLQQFWAYAAWGVILVLLGLALWRASRAGGIGEWGRRALPVLAPAAGIAMLVAIAAGFEAPGPWLPLVPIVLPPVMAAYALWGCLGRLPRAKVDGVAVGLIAALSAAVIPLWVLDAASYPGRLERHHAELAAADAAARAAGEQREQELRARFARLGPDSSLRDYIEARQWYLSGVDITGGARQVKSRQSDAIAMLDEGMILDLSDLWQLDLQPTQPLCMSYGKALAAAFGPSNRRGGSAFLNLLDTQVPNMRWLQAAGCDLDGPVGEIDAQVGQMLESPEANDPAAYYSKWGVGRETVQAMQVKLAEFRRHP